MTKKPETKTYPWKIAKMVAGSKTARTGKEHIAVSTKTGKQWGPNPYRVEPAQR